MVLEELGLTWEPVYLNFEQMKQPDYTKYNPNGRIPAIIDHRNGDFVLWYVPFSPLRILSPLTSPTIRESNAIIQYLADKYDPEHQLSVADENEKYTLTQWLYFQSSGQGPYYGQAFWFANAHPEKIPSAMERYRKEARRVLGVLESVLSKQEWLVGGKLTVADISFVP